jgi:hypothetical protein
LAKRKHETVGDARRRLDGQPRQMSERRALKACRPTVHKFARALAMALAEWRKRGIRPLPASTLPPHCAACDSTGLVRHVQTAVDVVGEEPAAETDVANWVAHEAACAECMSAETDRLCESGEPLWLAAQPTQIKRTRVVSRQTVECTCGSGPRTVSVDAHDLRLIAMALRGAFYEAGSELAVRLCDDWKAAHARREGSA